MIQIKQHIPNYCDGIDPGEGEAETTEELLEIPWVKKWKKETDFTHFAISDDRYLMAVCKFGHWVVGYVEGKVDLPEWKRGFGT